MDGNVRIPEVSVLEVSVLEASVLEVSIPEASIPEANIPKASMPETSFSVSNFKIDLFSRQVFIRESEKPDYELNLTPTEFKLLVYFLKNEKVLISKQNLIFAIWGVPSRLKGHSIDTHLFSLRKKLSSTGHSLQTVVKKGYVFSLSGESKS